MALFPPTQYDFPNVSNYDGDLRELLAYVKALSEDYSNIKELAEKMEEQYIQLGEDFLRLEKEVEDFRKEIADEVQKAVSEALTPYTEEYDRKIAAITADVNVINERVNTLEGLVENLYNLAKDYTDSKIIDLSNLMYAAIAYLQEQIDALQWTLPEVYNITKGVKTDLVTLIYDVYDACRDHAITAGEFDVLGLTAGAFDALQITAYQFDTNSKEILAPSNVCRNPLTGEMDTVCNILQAIASELTDQNITAEEFDAAELTAAEFDALNLTAYMFDFYAKQFINAA